MQSLIDTEALLNSLSVFFGYTNFSIVFAVISFLLVLKFNTLAKGMFYPL